MHYSVLQISLQAYFAWKVLLIYIYGIFPFHSKGEYFGGVRDVKRENPTEFFLEKNTPSYQR
jgi:hypothetical protein